MNKSVGVFYGMEKMNDLLIKVQLIFKGKQDNPNQNTSQRGWR